MRDPNTTKHDYGHSLLIAGAHGRMGCAILAARAALRSGCGLVSVHLPSRCVDPMQAAFPEAMVSIDPSPTHFTTLPDHLERYSAIAVGPGLGTHPETVQALLRLIETVGNLNRSFTPSHSLSLPFTPLILDADALNILATLPKEKLSTFNFQFSVLTPHAGEYRRLFGDADPAEMARRYGAIIVKKSHDTHIYAPDGTVTVNHTGNAGMATAGSGDVLTGILLGITAQKTSSLYDSVCKSVEIHGQIGDLAVQKQSQSSLIASDMVEKLKDIEI